MHRPLYGDGETKADFGSSELPWLARGKIFGERLQVTRIAWCCVLVALGCSVDKPSAHPTGDVPQTDEPTPTATTQSPVGEPSGRGEPEPGPGAFQVGEQRGVQSGVVFREAPPEKSTSSALARLLLVPVASKPSGGKVERFVALDDHPPRPFADKGIRLTSLLNEDEEVAPGLHRLVAFVEGATSTTFEVRHFWVDVAERAVSATGCVLARPAGTYNGEVSADALAVRVLPLEPSIEKVTLSWTGPLGADEKKSSIEAAPRAVVRIAGQKSGDYEIIVSCRNGAGVEVERVTRVVTVNRDAPQPPPTGKP